MFESISSKIEKALHTLRGKGSITDINVAETVKEVRKALLDADVSYPVAKEFTDKVKAEAMGRNVIQSIEPGQLMVKIVHEKLTELMGNAAVDINIKGTPAIILIAGLQGSGKTTFSAKLAHYLKTKRNKSVMLVAGDVYRPAAISQLKTLGEQIQVPVFTEEGNMNPIDIATKAVSGCGRGDDERDFGPEAVAQSAGDTLCGRLDDRSGRREHRQGLQRPTGLRRCGAD